MNIWNNPLSYFLLLTVPGSLKELPMFFMGAEFEFLRNDFASSKEPKEKRQLILFQLHLSFL
jgi:hypothetical protein